MTEDSSYLRQLVQKNFSAPPAWVGFDLLSKHATDPPLAIATLVRAVSEAAGPGSRVCELGFGDGWLLRELIPAMPQVDLVGVDQSEAYVRHARATLPFSVTLIRGDMESLPLAANAFDVVVTCWTLYLMTDIDKALAGIKRCLAPGGRLVAATIAPDHMIEHDNLVTEAVRVAGGKRAADVGLRFDLESGKHFFGRHFPGFELREWSGELRVADAESAAQLWAAYAPEGLDEGVQEAARYEYLRLASDLIQDQGIWRVRRHDGAFVGISA